MLRPLTRLTSLSLALQRSDDWTTPYSLMRGLGFPKAICDMTALEALHLSGLCDTSGVVWRLPEELSRLQRLRELDLNHFHHSGLPAALGQLTALEDVYIRAAPLSPRYLEGWKVAQPAMGPALSGLTALSSLVLNCQYEAPPALYGLPALIYLRLLSPRFPSETAADWLSALPALRELDLDGMQCPDGCLPQGLLQCTALMELSIQHLNLGTQHSLELPVGPYLSALKSVCVDEDTSARNVPASVEVLKWR